MNTTGTDSFEPLSMMEPETLDINHGARYSCLHDEIPSLSLPMGRADMGRQYYNTVS